MEEYLGPNSSPLEHVAGNGELLDDVMRHGLHDRYWCYIFERLVKIYSSIKTNNIQDEASFVQFYLRKFFTKVFLVVRSDSDGLLLEHRFLRTLHGSMHAHGNISAIEGHLEECPPQHMDRLVVVSSVGAAKSLWNAMLKYGQRAPCIDSLLLKGIAISNKRCVYREPTSEESTFLRSFWNIEVSIPIAKVKTYEKVLFRGEIYKVGADVVIKVDDVDQQLEERGHWKASITSFFSMQHHGQSMLFFAGRYYKQCIVGDTHSERLFIDAATGMSVLEKTPLPFTWDCVRPISSLLHKFIPMPLLRGQKLIAYEVKDLKRRDRLLEEGRCGNVPLWLQEHDIVKVWIDNGGVKQLNHAAVREINCETKMAKLAILRPVMQQTNTWKVQPINQDLDDEGVGDLHEKVTDLHQDAALDKIIENAQDDNDLVKLDDMGAIMVHEKEKEEEKSAHEDVEVYIPEIPWENNNDQNDAYEEYQKFIRDESFGVALKVKDSCVIPHDDDHNYVKNKEMKDDTSSELCDVNIDISSRKSARKRKATSKLLELLKKKEKVLRVLKNKNKKELPRESRESTIQSSSLETKEGGGHDAPNNEGSHLKAAMDVAAAEVGSQTDCMHGESMDHTQEHTKEHALEGSAVVVTPKKNGKWRVCVDYKPLNVATKRDHFPLPFQDEILNEVAGHERYTVCDGYSGYYQIRIAEEDQHKTTFITPWGCFAFRVMPFGLTNAPSTFTRFTSFIFQPFFKKSIRVFLDDFCAYSDRALHCQRVEEGLQRLYQYGGQLNPDKCHVAEKEVVLLGHVISQEGIKVDPSRVQAILDLPPPNSARQVITFVQKVRYMSCFIHLLSQIISPLQELANQEVFSWEQEHLECFNEVKEVLGSLPTIMPPDPQGTYYLCPSVGLDAFGDVLMQKDPKTAYMQPIYFTSKVMTQGFLFNCTIRKFRSYLLPKPFIILTLEHNLPYAIQHMRISSKISKWVLELQEYEYTFIVEDSTRASLADVLTYKVKEKKITPKAQGKLDFSPQGELEDAYTLLFDGAYRRQRNKATGGFVILNEVKKEVLKKGIQLHLAHSNNEAEYATLKAGLEECKSMGIKRLMVKRDALLIVRHVQGTWACKNSKLLQWLHEVKLLMKDFEAIQIQHISRQHNKEADNMANTQFEVMVGAIKFKEPLFQGQETMEDILYFLETGECPKHLERVQRHCLVRKALSYQLIGEYLYHKGKDLVLKRVPLVKEIEKILMSCHDGVCGGHFAQEITSRKILQAGFVWPSLHRDVHHWCKACKACQQAGPLPRTSTGKQYILTATDYMTRWAEAASVARITAADVSKFMLDYIYSRFGTPLEILSDRGPGFRTNLLDALLENLSIKHVHSTPYYPQCNGLVEKTNGVLCKIITKHVRDRPQDWDKHLIAALWAYRTSFKVSTQFTPYHLVYGQEALLPIEVELGSLRVLARETTSSKEKLEQRILDLQ
ncbi:hypothetical protein L7F22_021622 [Adiantum nelumboides]|nr:hypothetical protein [Adiantum nelumboides]